MEIQATIEGRTPLLMNAFVDETDINGANSGHSSAIRTKEKGTPRAQAEKKAYWDNETGDLYMPGPNILASLIEAGKFHKVGKTKVTTAKSTLVTAGIMINEVACSFGTKDFEVDSRRVVNPSTGGAMICHRPRLDEWKLSFTLDVDEEMFSADFVRTLVDDAGKKIGLGDFRPARKGPFGRFHVIEWKVIKNTEKKK